MFEAYLDSRVLDKLERHFALAAEKNLEAMGLLAGRVCRWKGADYVLVDEYLTSRNAATPVSVRFERAGLAELVSGLVEKGGKRIIVGWAHSHPGYGCFLSQTDLDTQRAFFGEPFNVALVVDPLRKEKKFFKLDGVGYREASFAVVKTR